MAISCSTANRAIAAVREQVATPLGLDVFDAAAGVVELFEHTLRNNLLGRIVGKGYGPENYALLSYGGGGPLHVAGYSAGLQFEDILIPAWAPGFSAFGCACGDFEYRYDQSVDLPLLPTDSPEQMRLAIDLLNGTWDVLEAKVVDGVCRQRHPQGSDRISPGAEDAVLRPTQRPGVSLAHRPHRGTPPDPAGFRGFVRQDLLQRRADARIWLSRHAGHHDGRRRSRTTAVATRGDRPRGTPRIGAEGRRGVYWQGKWAEAAIFDMEQLRGGNVIDGPAVVEAPASTLYVPSDRTVSLDRHRIFHMNATAPGAIV